MLAKINRTTHELGLVVLSIGFSVEFSCSQDLWKNILQAGKQRD
jgi:hypothetical protein